MKSSHLERILGKLDDLDQTNLTNLVQRLARERKLLETILNTIQEGILVIDTAGLIQYSNHAANMLINVQDADLGNSTLWKLVPDLSKSFSLKDLGNHLSVVSRDVQITYPEEKFLRIYIVPFDDDLQLKSLSQRFVVILTDITEEKYSTEELIENEKISSIVLLAAGVAHELGNPLNSINIHLQLIQRKLGKLKESEELSSVSDSIDTCISEVNRLDSVIKNFLDAVRPTKPELNDLNLLEILDEVIALLAQELEDLKVHVEINLSSEIPIVLGDRNQVKQVFFNVIKNAMDAMDAGGLLKINTTCDDDYLSLTFADTGVGIDHDNLAKVFEPYFSTKSGGHGLGMMIVQRIMRDHQGHIGIESKLDSGTSVTLQFPLKSRRTRLLQQST